MDKSGIFSHDWSYGRVLASFANSAVDGVEADRSQCCVLELLRLVLPPAGPYCHALPPRGLNLRFLTYSGKEIIQLVLRMLA